MPSSAKVLKRLPSSVTTSAARSGADRLAFNVPKTTSSIPRESAARSHRNASCSIKLKAYARAAMKDTHSSTVLVKSSRLPKMPTLDV